MASDPKDEKAELEAVAVVGTGELDAADGGSGGPPAPSPSGDSPKPHGDKMEHAVQAAAGTPPKGTPPKGNG